jgi:hypothetical protein
MSRLYVDGCPANIEAAASDALEWLRLFRENPDVSFRSLTDDERPKMGHVVDTLAKFVAESGEEVFKQSRRYPEAVAVIVASSRSGEEPTQ